MTTYTITKLFTCGILAGLTVTETTTVKFELNKEYASTGNSYKVIKIEEKC